MKITLNIDERTGAAIREFCKANNLKQNQYLIDIIEKQFNIDRYGDMNEMLSRKNSPVKKEKPANIGVKLPIEPVNDKVVVSEKADEPKKSEIPERKPVKRTLKTR